MQVFRSKNTLFKAIKKYKKNQTTIGLVPTMGALHEGHLSLVEMSKRQFNVTAVSIFVNPIQFNNATDLKKYPRSENKDLELLEASGVDLVFIPSIEEIYPQKPLVKLSFSYLEDIMEGKHRPGHFSGVGLVVLKLFGLVQPDGAYFGQKDLQQFKVINQLVVDFNVPVQLHMAPIIREPSGLAMSSRNQRLSQAAIKTASHLYKWLNTAKSGLLNGASVKQIQNDLLECASATDDITLEYFMVVDAETLHPKLIVNEGDRLALCLAAHVDEVRLIDNIIFQI